MFYGNKSLSVYPTWYTSQNFDHSHPLIVVSNKNIIMSSFKSSRNIQKKESGPYRGFAYIECSSVILYIWQKQPEQITEI